jgi:NodT family efflux transporter outer membrane factor (OMF) lipoprotein
MHCSLLHLYGVDIHERNTVTPFSSGSKSAQRTRIGGPLTLLLLTAGLSACASAPHREPVPTTVPDQFSSTGVDRLADRWWHSLGDTTLSRLIEQALADNLTLKVAYARLDQASATARRQKAGRFPSIDLQASASRTEQSDDSPTRRDFTNLSAGAAASYEVDLWGRLKSLSDAAALDREGSREDLKTAAISLSAQVASVHYQLVEQRAQLQVLAAQLQLNEQVLELVTLRFRRGQVKATDVLRQRQLVESTRGEMSLTRSRRAVFEHALAILLGRPPGEAVVDSSTGRFVPLPPPPQTGLPADLIQRRPDIRRAYLALLAADRRAAAAVAARFPRISLSAQSSTSGAEVGDLFDNWMANLAANLMMPLFDAGDRKAEVDRSRAVATERLYSYGQTVLAALGEVEDALVQEHHQREYLDNLESQLSLTRDLVARARDSYTSGATTYLQVLDALRTNQQLERSVLSAKRQLIGLRIDLYRTLGGGWEMPSLN